jgi:hypothetical protein
MPSAVLRKGRKTHESASADWLSATSFSWWNPGHGRQGKPASAGLVGVPFDGWVDLLEEMAGDGRNLSLEAGSSSGGVDPDLHQLKLLANGESAEGRLR